MAWKKGPVTLPADLEAELDKVREIAPPPPPPEDMIYKYWNAIYRLRQKLESSPEWKNAVEKYHKAHRMRIETNYIRFIIEQTAADHVIDNMKNKYKVTLQLALREGIKPMNVIAFIKRNGRLNGCVELWKQKYGRPRRKSRKKSP